MTRYADPTRCPDCRTMLPPAPTDCPACRLPLRDPLTHELFATLQRADSLLVLLRAVARPAPTPEAAAAPAGRERRPRGVRTASVPTILLGLGALCLLVAAVTFLALAWAVMGVGGRTAVLVGLTATVALTGTVLARRGLRVAGESLTAVALGLVVLDVLGAAESGWFGAPGADEVLLLLGLALAAAAAALLVATDRLVVPQVGIPVGLCAALLGASGALPDVPLAAGAAGTLAATAWAGRRVSAPVLVWVAGAGAATWWSWLVLLGFTDAAADPTMRGLWADGAGAGLAAATLLALLPAVVLPRSEVVVRACTAVAASLLTVTLAFPVLDETTTRLGVVALAALLTGAAVAVALPRWRSVVAAPLAVTALPALGIVVGLALQAVTRITTVGAPFTRDADVRLAPADPMADPLLALPLAGALVLAAWVLADRPVSSRWAYVAGTALVGAGLVTLASYAVPLAVVVAALAAVALALAVLALRIPEDAAVPALAAAGVAAVTAGCALPSDWLTTAVAAVAVVVGAMLVTARSEDSRLVGDGLLPASLAGLVWCVGSLADVEPAWRGLPVLAVAGLLAIARPRVVLEVSGAASAVLAGSVSVAHAADQPTSLALHLTLAGALVTTSGLVHADRRELGWLGGFLLAAATWVRLYDIGVDAPEAYTLPTAVALVLVGLHQLWREPGSSTEVLLPGLALATVPSLLWVIAVDPVAPRALFLGLACLGLVLAGTRLGWGTPIVIGVVVGGLLVLTELAPYAAATERWVLIGLAGTVLTVTGVTWERRVAEMRQAATYLGRLR